MTDKDIIFQHLCRHYCSVMDGWIPYPSTVLQRQLPHLSLYKVRKYLKELKSEGLIVSDLYVDMGDDRPILIRGYTLTVAGRNTEMCKQAHEEERELCKKCFHFDIGPAKNYSVEVDDLFDL